MTDTNKNLLQDIMTQEEITTISRNPHELVLANNIFASEISVIAFTLRDIVKQLDKCAQQHTPLACLVFTHALQKRLHNIHIDKQKYRDTIRSAMKQEEKSARKSNTN